MAFLPEVHPLGTEQFSERDLFSLGYRREANREGMQRYTHKGNVVEVGPDGRWAHYHKGKPHKDGTGGHAELAKHLAAFHSSQHSEVDQDAIPSALNLHGQPGIGAPVNMMA